MWTCCVEFKYYHFKQSNLWKRFCLRLFKCFFFLVAGDEGFVADPRGHVLQQQWVTLTASMWPEPTASPRGWRVPTDRLPLLAAVFCGAALVVCVLFALIVYRCCIMPRKEKHYCKFAAIIPGLLFIDFHRNSFLKSKEVSYNTLLFLKKQLLLLLTHLFWKQIIAEIFI